MFDELIVIELVVGKVERLRVRVIRPAGRFVGAAPGTGARPTRYIRAAHGTGFGSWHSRLVKLGMQEVASDSFGVKRVGFHRCRVDAPRARETNHFVGVQRKHIAL
jgi:hypothetical protein